MDTDSLTKLRIRLEVAVNDFVSCRKYSFFPEKYACISEKAAYRKAEREFNGEFIKELKSPNYLDRINLVNSKQREDFIKNLDTFKSSPGYYNLSESREFLKEYLDCAEYRGIFRSFSCSDQKSRLEHHSYYQRNFIRKCIYDKLNNVTNFNIGDWNEQVQQLEILHKLKID